MTGAHGVPSGFEQGFPEANDGIRSRVSVSD